MSALGPLSDGVQAVSDLYAERCDIKRDDAWYLLKLQEELGELVQAHLRLTGRGRLKGQSVEALRFHLRGKPIRVTVSCGLTELREGDTAATVFDRADAALYRAKHGGRNLCVAA